MTSGACPADAHMVLALTSLTLKSKQVYRWLAEAPKNGIRVRVLHESEIAWKAWYAGRGGGPSYLLASPSEREQRQRIGDCDFYVGACEPRKSREGGEKD